ncbi:MAG: helix-turn-helix transcriptional regulator [Bryobacteraceae bacterium]|jgi:cytoskeletal protein RodZ
MKLECGAPPDLITVRRKKGVSLQDISETTKIGVNYLRAIEDGEFAKLPGGIYSTSYIRQYARAIDYNESELLEHYYRATGLRPEATLANRDPSGRDAGPLTPMPRRVSRVPG